MVGPVGLAEALVVADLVDRRQVDRRALLQFKAHLGDRAVRTARPGRPVARPRGRCARTPDALERGCVARANLRVSSLLRGSSTAGLNCDLIRAIYTHHVEEGEAVASERSFGCVEVRAEDRQGFVVGTGDTHALAKFELQVLRGALGRIEELVRVGLQHQRLPLVQVAVHVHPAEDRL